MFLRSAARFFLLFCFFAALRLLARNHFRVHPFRWGMVFTVLFCGIINSVLCLLQHCLHGKKIANVSLDAPPIFIVGHWRSGTTYLHELMVRDKRFGYASTYDCFAPHHFVMTSWILPKIFWFLLIPVTRKIPRCTEGQKTEKWPQTPEIRESIEVILVTNG